MTIHAEQTIQDKQGLNGIESMMELTRKGEYGVRGIIYLAQQEPGHVVLMNEIAAAIQAPPNFLAKILQSFTKLGIVKSFRGTGGGFAIGRSHHAQPLPYCRWSLRSRRLLQCASDMA